MFYNSYLEKRMTEHDFNNFTTDEKNYLISELARKNDMMIHDVTGEFILEHHKKLKTKMLNEQCEEMIENGFTSSNGHTYRVNRDDQINMLGKKQEVDNDNTIIKVYWKAEDVGVWIEHSRDEWLTVYKEAFSHKENQLIKCSILKQKVKEATTHQEIIDINWDTPLQ